MNGTSIVEPTIIPLHTIFRDVEQLRRLHEVQLRRARELAFTDGERPDGLRLSIDDPVRRVKACFDSWWQTPVKAEIGERGYLCEDLLEVGVVQAIGVPYESQVAIPWGPTELGSQSAYDFVLDGGQVVSCKSSTTAPIEKLKPSTANVAQEKRMLALDGRAAGVAFDIWMVHPGCLSASGPFTYTLEQDDITAAIAEAERVALAWRYFAKLDAPLDDLAWNDPDAWLQLFGLESTSGAFRFATLDACGAIEARNRRFIRARAEAADAKRAEEEAKAAIRPFIEEQLELARQDDPNVKSIVAHSGDQLVTYTIDARGALRITERPLEAAGAAA